MTERHPDADQAVDEQKRKARRRLVGAVVLALAAAVILPMLLEKDPQPLGEDVSVQIPPVDEGKFVNRLTRKGPADAFPKAEPKSEPKSAANAAKPDVMGADAAKAAAPDAAPKPVVEGGGAPPSAPVAQAAPPAQNQSIAAAEQRVLATSASKSTPAVEAKASAPDKSAPAPAAEAKASPPAAPAATVATAASTSPAADAKAAPSGTFAVQLAAFSDDKGANALANKLKKAGYATAHVEVVDTSHGKLWRVRVGGFGTRAEAEAARVKLKSEGFNGMVAPAR